MKKKSIIFILLLVSVFIVGYISFNLFNNKTDKSVQDNNTVKNNKIEYIGIDELKNGGYDSNKIKEYKYNNISYDNNLSVIIPSVDKINEISVKGVYPYKNIKDPVELVDEEIKFIKHYIGTDYDEKYLYDMSGLEYKEMIEKIKEGTYFDKDNKEMPGLTYYIEDESKPYKYAHVYAGFNIIWFDKGEIYSLEKDNKSAEPENVFEVIKEYELDGNIDDEYQLKDGTATIRKAIERTEKYFNEELPYETNKEVKMKVCHVKVLKVSDDLNILQFYLAREYQGIPFEYGGTVWDTDSDDKYSKDRAIAYMINTDDMDVYCGTYDGNTDRVEAKDNLIENIVSPEEALNIVSDKIGNNSSYTITKIEVIYRLKIINDTLSEGTEHTGIPCYKITGINSNDSKETYFYVEMKNGNILYARNKSFLKCTKTKEVSNV